MVVPLPYRCAMREAPRSPALTNRNIQTIKYRHRGDPKIVVRTLKSEKAKRFACLINRPGGMASNDTPHGRIMRRTPD
jgi:hypothetical protein